jgi:hypothetical protein
MTPQINTLSDFIAAVWEALGLALALNPEAAKYVAVQPASIAVVITVALIAGVSLLIGQSVVLFLNRVPKSRFVITLLLNAVIYVANLVVWSTVIWVVSTFVLNATQPIGIGAMALLLSSAPFIFGFLVLAPYLGLIIVRVLYAWSLLISIVLIETIYSINALQALVCVGLGWLLLLILNRTVGKPIVAVRDRLFRRFTGGVPYLPTSSPEGAARTRRIGMRTEAELLRRRADELNIRDEQ